MSVDLKSIFGNRIKIDTKLRSIMGVFFNQESQEVTDYKPSYQRNYVWDDEKASYFIESIFLGTEIPPLVYYKTITDETIKNEIIDGRQRYQSILRFVNGDLRLKKNGLQRLGEQKDLVGKTFDELTPTFKSLFQETRIRIIEIRFLSEHTAEEEDSLKKEIFQRYNSGITPLKDLDIYKAQYYYNDLNSYLKHELSIDYSFDSVLSRVLRFEKGKLEQKVMKIREMLVLNRIPIKYYAIQKQQVIRKYFELLSDQITEDNIKEVYDEFKRRLSLLDFIEAGFTAANVAYNRLVGECLYWAISIVEIEKNTKLNSDFFPCHKLVNYIKDNLEKFTTVRSSFANILFERYKCMADFFIQEFDCEYSLYLYNNERFKRDNRNILFTPNAPLSFDDLRINKPDPTSVEVSELLLNINTNRFLIRPPYQRNEVGNRKKSSSIIESLLLGITLPPIFVFKREDGVSEVIDGQQRLLSILGFIGKPYKDERFNEQYSIQNKFALDLKDNGILKGDLQGKRFDDLMVKDRNKILSSDLWVIDIKESQNKNFDPVDLFVRLNNKPYPISKDSFEMWNSFANRHLIDTIKNAVSHSDKWFYLRKNNARMDNESLFTTLAYFQYAFQQKGNALGDIVPERTMELFNIEKRISCRFRMRSEITKLMEQDENTDFIYAINCLEFGFVRNVKTILSYDEQTINTNILGKRFDSLLNFESSKRTQMMFYVLWILLHDLSTAKIASKKEVVFGQIKSIVSMLSDGSNVEQFKKEVNSFRSEYVSYETKVEFCLPEVSTIYEFKEDEEKQSVDMLVDLVANPMRRFNVQHVQGQLSLRKQQIGIKVIRSGIDARYVESILKSRLFYIYCKGLKVQQVRKSHLQNILIPFTSHTIQKQFAKLLLYTEIATGLEREYFERILDLLVYEIAFIDEFRRANITFINHVKNMPDLAQEVDENQRKIIIKEEFDKQNQPDNPMALMLLKSIDLSVLREIEKM